MTEQFRSSMKQILLNPQLYRVIQTLILRNSTNKLMQQIFKTWTLMDISRVAFLIK